MKISQISFLVFVLLSYSCSLTTTKNLEEKKTPTSNIRNSYFADIRQDYIYKTHIDIYDNDLGGIMIFKKMNTNHHRIVCTTEFGNKIFDFELINNKLKKNYILDKLDKKVIINTLAQDFKTLLQENSNVIRFYTNTNYNVYRTQQKRHSNFYFIDRKNKLLKRITHTTKFKEKFNILFFEIENNISKRISIEHKGIKLKISLSYIGN